jgi:hypothetical protein
MEKINEMNWEWLSRKPNVTWERLEAMEKDFAKHWDWERLSQNTSNYEKRLSVRKLHVVAEKYM